MEKLRFLRQLALLPQAKVDWGRARKGRISLIRELYRGESTLRRVKHEEAQRTGVQEGILRELSIAAVYVYYQPAEGPRLQLYETAQVQRSGQVNRRDFGWVSEKALPRETPEQTTQRALREELGLSVETERVRYRRTIVKSDTQTPYPGLNSRVIANDYEVTLTDKEYNNNIVKLQNGDIVKGFMEVQRDKRTYFTWKEVTI